MLPIRHLGKFPVASNEIGVDRKSPIPAYAQVKRRLHAMIVGWRDGSARFYGDEALSAMFGVSRVTVRRALDQLVDEGYLVRRRGVGTYVATDKIDEHLNAEVDFFDQWAGSGRTLRAKVIATDIRPAPAAVALMLDISPGSPVLYIERLRTADASPVAFDVRYVLEEFRKPLTREVIARKSILDVLRTRHQLGRVDYRIEAGLASGDERTDHLGLLPGDPIIIRKLHYLNAAGKGLMCGHSVYRADEVRFAISLPLDPKLSKGSRPSSGKFADLIPEFRQH